MKDWADFERVNSKEGCKALGIAKGNLISGTWIDQFGDKGSIPHTMAGVDLDSDEYQAWYKSLI